MLEKFFHPPLLKMSPIGLVMEGGKSKDVRGRVQDQLIENFLNNVSR